MTPEEIRQRVRIHESGHAICGRALLLEDPPRVVASSDGSGATVQFLPISRVRDRMTRAEWRAFMESTAISSLAGQAALDVFGDADPGRGADSDRQRARTTAEVLDPAAVDATMDRLYQRALALVRVNRAAIGRFVATLAANHNRLTDDEVRIALDAAMAGGPTPRFTGTSRPISREDFIDQLKEFRA